jgi:uncharacterized repeat protein (TIGR03803 family)
MRVKRIFIPRAASAMLTAILFVTSAWAAHEARILHTFGEGADGANPEAGLIADGHGNLYGTTELGGANDAGTVFGLSPGEGGSWTETVLHNFDHQDGSAPVASLIFDAAGNLYGTTIGGGTHGYGTVFELSPNGSGGWTETVLHSFDNFGGDGNTPIAGLIRDAAGNLYGTTEAGGTAAFGCDTGCGTVFKLSPNGSGGWSETVLHRFDGDDGAKPFGGVIFDGTGNLYGTTSEGGRFGSRFGAVFQLSPNGSGGWSETVLHAFAEDDAAGSNPMDGLIFDAAGSLYGTAFEGGANRAGTAFKLSPNGSGGWTATALHSFGGRDDGWNPDASLVFDTAGSLYGTTERGGVGKQQGTVYKLSPNGSGGWTETALHVFNRQNGAGPQAAVIVDSAGNVYGTTRNGGAHNAGVVFQVAP